jgi:hypothetical protein
MTKKDLNLTGWEYDAMAAAYKRGDFVLSVNDNGRGCEYYYLMLRSKEHPELDCGIELYRLDNVEPRCEECCRNAKEKLGITLNF